MTIIAGSEEEYNEVITLLADAGLKKTITGRAAVSSKDENAVCTVANLHSFVQKTPVSEIIFCHGELKYSDIIKIFEHLPKEIFIRFHTRGTKSIAGSNSKNTAGECISANIDSEWSMAGGVYKQKH
ncbi:MAG: hypothetical protein WKG06_33390 [Segetibacter sp.]